MHTAATTRTTQVSNAANRRFRPVQGRCPAPSCTGRQRCTMPGAVNGGGKAPLFQAPLFGGAVAPMQRRPQSATGPTLAFSTVAHDDELEATAWDRVVKQEQLPRRPASAVAVGQNGARQGYSRGPGGWPKGGRLPGGAHSPIQLARSKIRVSPGSLVALRAKSKYPGRWGYVCRVYDQTVRPRCSLGNLSPAPRVSWQRGGVQHCVRGSPPTDTAYLLPLDLPLALHLRRPAFHRKSST